MLGSTYTGLSDVAVAEVTKGAPAVAAMTGTAIGDPLLRFVAAVTTGTAAGDPAAPVDKTLAGLVGYAPEITSEDGANKELVPISVGAAAGATRGRALVPTTVMGAAAVAVDVGVPTDEITFAGLAAGLTREAGDTADATDVAGSALTTEAGDI